MKGKFLNIKIDGEENIGVISLGEFKFGSDQKKSESEFKQIVEPKIVEALRQHFDSTVKIRLIELTSTLPPIEATIEVVVEALDEDRNESVFLSETWIY